MADWGVEVFSREEFPHGLRCASCSKEFTEGQPISHRLDAMDTCEGLERFGVESDEPLMWTTLICVDCAFAGAFM